MPAILAAAAAARRVARVPERLVDRDPRVPTERLLAELVPPPRFSAVRFSTYLPDPAQPTQAAAVAPWRRSPTVRRGAAAPRAVPPNAGAAGGPARGLPRRRLRRRQDPPAGLPVARPAAERRKAFGTFVELTNLVGALGFQQTVADAGRAPAAVHRRVRAGRPRRHRPGVHAARPARRRRAWRWPPPPTRCPAARRGPLRRRRLPARDPGSVGALRCRADRRRGLPPPRSAGGAPPRTPQQVLSRRVRRRGATRWTTSRACSTHLAKVHPSRYGALIDGV